MDKVERRSVIEYIHMKGKIPSQIFHEIKYQSMEWKLPKEPSPKKIKASCSAVKVMLTVFWDIILADFYSCRHKHEPRILFISHKVSKAEMARKRRNKLRKGHAFSSKTMHRHIGQA